MGIADVVHFAPKWNKIVCDNLFISEGIYFITDETTMVLAFSSKCGLVDERLNCYCNNLFSSTMHRASSVPTLRQMKRSKTFENKIFISTNSCCPLSM